MNCPDYREAGSLIPRLESVKSVRDRTPIDDRRVLADREVAIGTAVSAASHGDDGEDARLRRSARRFALLLMALSGAFVIASVVGAWFVLHG